jgi:NAD-dependent dihydropyrimidine dehydrogenase PreA subunit
MAMFIRIDVDQNVLKKSPGVAKKLVEVCPVKIYAQGSEANTVAIVEENVDECTLCDLCMKTSPDGVRVVKLYED